MPSTGSASVVIVFLLPPGGSSLQDMQCGLSQFLVYRFLSPAVVLLNSSCNGLEKRERYWRAKQFNYEMVSHHGARESIDVCIAAVSAVLLTAAYCVGEIGSSTE